jgi:F-type H+-transporting ATPase subunit delta
MKETRLAIRYAKALLELALEKKLEDKVKIDMMLVSEICESNREFRRMLSNPVINAEKKESILSEIFKNKIEKISLSFLILITGKKREVHIDEIAKSYIEQFKEEKGIKTAIIETPVELDNAARERIIALLKEKTKSKIELVESINKNLIGGFKLTFDNKQYDTSILSDIQKLKREFNVNIYEKGF